MDLLRALTTLSDPDLLCQLDVSNLLNFPMYLLWKDQNGKYLGCNDPLATILGFSAGKDLLGCTDHDLCWSESAAIYRANDQRVMLLNKPQITIEPGKIHDGSVVKAISYKLPLRSRDNKIMGVMGVCILIDEYARLEEKPDHPVFKSDSIIVNELPARQRECLYCLARGMTIKEIAHEMKLSPRTVAHYLERIKSKLQCNSRSQLIAKIIGT